MIKSITRLEYKIGDRVYHFLCDQDSPIGEVHDALCAFKAKTVEIINAAVNAETKKEEPKTEDPL